MASNRKTLFECDDCKRMFQSMEMFTLHNCADTATGGFTPADLDEVGELGNVSIDSLPDIPDTAVWNRPATLLIIEGYRSREDLLKQGKLRKRALWKLIKEDLQEKGFRYNEQQVEGQQVEGRWKSFMRGIKTVADHNRKSGNSKKAHPYEIELQFCITPANVALNQVVNSSQPRPSTSGEKATDPVTQKRKSSDNQELKSKKQQKNPSSSYKSPLSQVMDVMTTFVQASEKRHQEELARQERCHQEKMNLFANFLDHLKNSK